MSRLRAAIERLNTRKLDRVLRDIAPDQVICTHFLPAQLLSRELGKGDFQQPVWVQVTDFDIHALWVQPHLAGYFAASDEVAWRMIERGIPRSAIHVTGIPIMPAFAERQSRSHCAAELGIDPSRTTLLMMSGGAGVGGMSDWLNVCWGWSWIFKSWRWPGATRCVNGTTGYCRALSWSTLSAGLYAHYRAGDGSS
jgi:processive 1,2-diacylglycerol beta-glucosyltransferase